MCGIVGAWFQDLKMTDPSVIREMGRSLSHRGPDGDGYYEDKSKGLYLGHRRLKIIDLSENAHQPMSNEDQTVWVTYNGEIYNYKPLRDLLISKGHQFKSQSDTEVLVHGFEEWGIRGLLDRINGIFAFAIWDKRSSSLFLARDRLGVKPLYYFWNSNHLLFGSEIKALLASKLVSVGLENEELARYLRFRYTRNDKTLFKNIKNLKPGHYLQIADKKKSEETAYWDIQFRPSDITKQEAIKVIETMCDKSVRSQLVSDVPIGVFLSGGLDSSAITAIASQSMPGIHTFSIGFNHAEYNELKYAREIAEKYQTNHHEYICEDKEYFEDLRKLVWHRDSPLEVPNEVLIYKMSRELKKYFTVVLSGEGADEVFMGYPKYRNIFKVHKRFNSKLGLIRSIGKSLLRKDHSNLSIQYSEKKDLEIFSRFYLGNSFAPDLISNEFIREHCPGFPLSFIEGFFSDNRSFEENVQYFDYKNHLHSLLMRMDRMTMAASVEARVPFLDHELVEYALSLPVSLKISNETEKFLLKKAMETKLPKNIIYRKKMGFPVPLNEWLMNSQVSFIKEQILDGRLIKSGILDKKSVLQLFNQTPQAYSHEPLYGEFIWRIYNLEIWQDIFL